MSYFKTIRLYDYSVPAGPGTVRDTVLDYFTAENTNKVVRRGVVNMNATDPDVLNAVFHDVPVYYPGNTNILSGPEASKLGSNIVAAIGGGGATNLSDIGKVDFRASLAGRTDLERKASIAYSCQLMGVRQNLFTIVIAAGAASRGMGLRASAHIGEWLGYQRAVAVVWRDPYPDDLGHCAYFVKYFRMLDE